MITKRCEHSGRKGTLPIWPRLPQGAVGARMAHPPRPERQEERPGQGKTRCQHARQGDRDRAMRSQARSCPRM
jgi:hypothetical protein